jgi:hypothetical protein
MAYFSTQSLPAVVESFADEDEFTPGQLCGCGRHIKFEEYGPGEYLVNGRLLNDRWDCPLCARAKMKGAAA